MYESDVSSSASKSGAVGRPPDCCWQFFGKVCEPNALGELIAQGSNNGEYVSVSPLEEVPAFGDATGSQGMDVDAALNNVFG